MKPPKKPDPLEIEEVVVIDPSIVVPIEIEERLAAEDDDEDEEP